MKAALASRPKMAPCLPLAPSLAARLAVRTHSAGLWSVPNPAPNCTVWQGTSVRHNFLGGPKPLISLQPVPVLTGSSGNWGLYLLQARPAGSSGGAGWAAAG